MITIQKRSLTLISILSQSLSFSTSSLSNSKFENHVKSLYEDILGRNPAGFEVSGYFETLNRDKNASVCLEVTRNFFNSEEYKNAKNAKNKTLFF